VVTVMAFGLILWLHSADTAARFQNVLLFVSYWIPAFVAIVSVDWWLRTRRLDRVDPARAHTPRADAVAALVTFVAAYAVAVPFMNTSIFVGAMAQKWHGADVAYFVNFLVALALYGGYCAVRSRRSPQPLPSNLDR
jgi:NCS1 family nucleobase:cation symporter-1